MEIELPKTNPNRCRCGGKGLITQDKKTGKYFCYCDRCKISTAKFVSPKDAVRYWNYSAGKPDEEPAPAVGSWISVKAELPKDNEKVLVRYIGKRGYIKWKIGTHDFLGWTVPGAISPKVTHWTRNSTELPQEK